MIVYPAIDLKEGRCVRLVQGDPGRETVFSEDPAETARRWEREGAQWLHVVDLDAAFGKGRGNRKALAAVLSAVSIPVQAGGGVRTMADAEALFALGVSRVIVGTAALRDPAFLEAAALRFPGKVALGLDARGGLLAVSGWAETSQVPATECARRFSGLPLAAVIFTDIARDGTRGGVNIEATRALCEAASPVPVIASGGVADLSDILALAPLVPAGLSGVIAGRALYDGSLSLPEALSLARRLAAGKT